MKGGVSKNAIANQIKVKNALARLDGLVDSDISGVKDFPIDELKNFDGVKIEIGEGEEEGISFKTARYLLKKVSDSKEQEKYSGLLEALFDSVEKKIAYKNYSDQELQDIIDFIRDIKDYELKVDNILENSSKINWFDDIAQLSGDQELKKFTARIFAKLDRQHDIEKLNRYIIDKTIDLDNDGITLNQLLSANKEWQRPQVIVAVIQAYAPNAKTIEEIMNSKVFEESIKETGDSKKVYIPKEEFARCALKYLAKKEQKLNENELSLAKSAIASINNFGVDNFNAIASAIEKHDDIYEQNKDDLNRMKIGQVRVGKLDKDSELNNISSRLKGNYELAKKILSLTNVKKSSDFIKIVYNMLPSDPKETTEMMKSTLLSDNQYEGLCHTIQREINNKSQEIETLLSNRRVKELSKRELKERVNELRTIIEKGSALLIANEKLYETDQGKNLAFLLAKKTITRPPTKKDSFEGSAHEDRLKIVPIILEPLNKVYDSLDESRKNEIDFLWSRNAGKIKGIKERSSSGERNYKELNEKIKSRGLDIMKENQSQVKEERQVDNKTLKQYVNEKIDKGIEALSEPTKIDSQIIRSAIVQEDTEGATPRAPKLQYAVNFLDAIIAMEYGDPKLNEQIEELKKDQAKDPAKKANLESLEKANNEFKQRLQEKFLESLKGDQAKAQNVINTLEVIQGQLEPLLNRDNNNIRYAPQPDKIIYKINDLKKYAQAEKIIAQSKALAEQTAALTIIKLKKELDEEEKKEFEDVVKKLKGGSNKEPNLDDIIKELNSKVDVNRINDSVVSDENFAKENANQGLINKLELAKDRFKKVAAEVIKENITKDEAKLIRQTLAYNEYSVVIKNQGVPPEDKKCRLSEVTTPFLSGDGNLKLYDTKELIEEGKGLTAIRIQNDLEFAFNFILDTNYEGTIKQIQATDQKKLLIEIINKCTTGHEDLIKALQGDRDLDKSQKGELAKALSEVVWNGNFQKLQYGDQLAAASSGHPLWRYTFTREEKMYEKGQKLLKDIFAEDLRAIEQRRLGKSLVGEGFESQLSEIIDSDQLLSGVGQDEHKEIEIKENWLVRIWNALWNALSRWDSKDLDSNIKDIEAAGIESSRDKELNKEIKKLEDSPGIKEKLFNGQSYDYSLDNRPNKTRLRQFKDEQSLKALKAEKEALYNVKLEISKKLDKAKIEQSSSDERDKQLRGVVENDRLWSSRVSQKKRGGSFAEEHKAGERNINVNDGLVMK